MRSVRQVPSTGEREREGIADPETEKFGLIFGSGFGYVMIAKG
jgi:hypothetical protein